MADRFPLILNTSTNQIQEIPSGDNLDLTGTGINNAGIITAGNVTIGAATTDLVVNGDARVTGILTVGTSSLKLDGPNNLVNVGTALTLGHSQGLQFHTQNLHSAGFEVNQINASGIITATEADINGDIDVDGHTNLDNVSVAGVSTFASNVIVNGGISNAQYLNLSATAPSIDFNDTNHNSDFMLQNANGLFKLYDNTNTADRVTVASNGNVSVKKDLDVDGHTNLDNVSIAGVATVTGNLNVGGVLTYEDVTNVDSIGIITARNGITVSSGTATFQGAIDANGDIDVDGHTNLDNVSVAGVSTFTGNADFSSGVDITGTLNVAGAIDSTVAGGDNNFTVETTSSGDPRLKLAAAGSGGHDIEYIRSSNTLNFKQAGGSVRLSIDATGHLLPGIDSQYNIGSSSVRFANVYADTLYGDGSNLTGITQTTINSNTNNYLITGTGTANTLQGESNLTFDGSRLTTQAVTINDNGVSGIIFDVRTDDQSPWMLHFGNDSYHGDGGLYAYQSNGGAFEFRARGNNEYINLDFNRWNGSTNQNWLRLNANGAVELSNSGSTKLATIGTGIEIYGGSADWSETNPGPTKGSIHLDPNDSTNHFGSAITFGASDHNSGQSAQAGIYTRTDGSYGTQMYFATTSSYNAGSYARFMIDYNGHVLPTVNGNYDLGASGKRWRNIYTSDLQLSNEGKTNDVDNTWGNYTIQEGESDLFLINNRSGKKYKFNLTEVS